MFERYTEKARRTIFFAKHEASQFGSTHIEPEHLLLGVFNDGFLASRVLEGISVQRLREEILSLLPRASPTSGDLPLSASAKKALSYGAEEADRLGDRQIRNQHLLLGIMRVEDCSAARLLTQKGLRPESLRVHIAGLSPEEETRWGAGQTREPFWKSPGIPAGYAWPRLLYNPASEVLIVELRAAGQQFVPTRLFMRPKNSQSYEQIGNPAGDVSYESPVTCEKQPIVVFNSFQMQKRGDGWAGDWAAVCAFNLQTKELAVCIGKETLALPAPYTEGWISELVSLSDDGHTLHLKVGIKDTNQSMVYYLARTELGSKGMELISPLTDSFF